MRWVRPRLKAGMTILLCKPGRPGDDRVQLLDQPVVGIELAVAVGALGNQDVDVLDRRRVGEEVGVAPAQVAGEDEPARPAVLAVIELDDRRAQDVAGFEIGQGHARHDFRRLVVGQALESLDDPLDVGQLEQRLECLDVGVAEMGVAHFLALDPRAVAEHDVGDVAGGRRGVDRPGIAGPDQARQAADVVVVGVRHDHRVERARVERELAVGAVGIDPVGIEQPAIKQDPPGIDLQQMGAARDFLGRAVKRDSQPNYLPTIDRAPAARPDTPRAGPRDRRSSRSIVPGPLPTSYRLNWAIGQGRGLCFDFRSSLIHSIMPGTPAGFKPENQGMPVPRGSCRTIRKI